MPVTRNKGFTLIEIAIVITIIGLLMAGVLKGMSLIQSAKVSSAITLAQDISVAVNAFKQQYHMLPGDMAVTSADFPNIRTGCQYTGGSTNNGLIDTSTESQCVPEVLYNAGLAKVDRDSNGLAVFQTSYGPVSVIATSQSAVVKAGGTFLPSIIHVVEFKTLPCDVANAIDSKIDDGNTNTGNVLSSPACINNASGIPATTTLDVPL